LGSDLQEEKLRRHEWVFQQHDLKLYLEQEMLLAKEDPMYRLAFQNASVSVVELLSRRRFLRRYLIPRQDGSLVSDLKVCLAEKWIGRSQGVSSLASYAQMYPCPTLLLTSWESRDVFAWA